MRGGPDYTPCPIKQTPTAGKLSVRDYMESGNIFKRNSIFSHGNTALIFLLFLLFGLVQGQTTYQISGKVVDKDGKDFQDVRLNLYLSNKLLIGQDETDRKGKFEFKKLKPDKYTLNVYGGNGYSLAKQIDLTAGDVKGLELAPSQDRKQPQVEIESEIDLIKIKWGPIVDGKEYIIYKDNREIGRVSVPE